MAMSETGELVTERVLLDIWARLENLPDTDNDDVLALHEQVLVRATAADALRLAMSLEPVRGDGDE
jgi:hypothetical protein